MTDPRSIADVDPVVANLIEAETGRQQSGIQLIASENFASRAVMEASGSVFTNKYAEGYPGRRYYEGCQITDQVEQLAIDRAKELFSAEHANVQPHSGSQANMAAYFAVLEAGDTIMGMSLDHGGHLTHGSHVSFSGTLFNFVSYGLNPETELIEMDEVRRLALEHRPKMIIAGYSAYSRHLDYEAFRAIADEIDAILLVDAAHFIGLVAGKAMPNPMVYADIVTATTHKAMRGPRGGMILSTEEHAKAINKAVFPGYQGGAIFSQIAGKAVAFLEAMTPEYQEYAAQIIRNAQTLAGTLQDGGLRVVSGGTDNHLMLLDLRSLDEELTGKEAAVILDEVGITLNRNAIPNDPRPPFVTSGLRIGTPSVTTAGMREGEMERLGALILDTLTRRADDEALKEVADGVAELVAAFPPYPADFPGHV
ncbi:MAG: serine hydroxymethyltransferase [Acidimicrobiia bacterium]|nr:serine hydroxymethyltransferase [Acidimicrobiia bacterium]MBT8216186.1 serine hydroxymethyltransferase [Acidimicrobiia bacterium]NNF09586.1 serine hydroxymethyltransferase [Acidimicrobiia bacterium]NNL69585.1 serine hydroxymethyltransferase [Acidimicrobiia bacterium]